MICDPCLQGGRWNTEWRMYQDAAALILAERLHSECVGGTRCVCQHAVGSESLKVMPYAGK